MNEAFQKAVEKLRKIPLRERPRLAVAPDVYVSIFGERTEDEGLGPRLGIFDLDPETDGCVGVEECAYLSHGVVEERSPDGMDGLDAMAMLGLL